MVSSWWFPTYPVILKFLSTTNLLTKKWIIFSGKICAFCQLRRCWHMLTVTSLQTLPRFIDTKTRFSGTAGMSRRRTWISITSTLSKSSLCVNHPKKKHHGFWIVFFMCFLFREWDDWPALYALYPVPWEALTQGKDLSCPVELLFQIMESWNVMELEIRLFLKYEGFSYVFL